MDMWNYSVRLTDGTPLCLSTAETMPEAKRLASSVMIGYRGDRAVDVAIVWHDEYDTRFEWRRTKDDPHWKYYATPLDFYIKHEDTHCYTICAAVDVRVYTKVTAHSFAEALSIYNETACPEWYEEEWVSHAEPVNITNDDTDEMKDLMGGSYVVDGK